MTAETFLQEATKLLNDRYRISPADIDLDLEACERCVNEGETPQEYISWIAAKHGLTPIEAMTPKLAQSVINIFKK